MREHGIGESNDYFFFFGFGGGSFSRVSFTILASSSPSSSHSAFTGAVFFDPGYAFVSWSSKRLMVSEVVFRKRVLSQTRANIRPCEYTQYSPIIGLKVISGTRERHSCRYSRVDLEVDILFFDYMYRSSDCNKPICPKKRKPEWHYSEEAISLKCLDTCRNKNRLWNQHKEKSRKIYSTIVFLSPDI